MNGKYYSNVEFSSADKIYKKIENNKVEIIQKFVKKSNSSSNLKNKNQSSEIKHQFPSVKIGVVIPAYNEETNIGQTLAKIPNDISDKLDIIVVDDGSTDKTCEIAGCLDNIYILRHSKNRGNGAAIRTGIEFCKRDNYDIVIILDADGQHDPQDLKKFINPIITDNVDFVIGNRFKYYYDMDVTRKIFSILMTVIYLILFQKKISDPTIGYRALSSRLIKNLKFELDYSITQEMLFKIIPYYSFTEVPTKVYEGKNGTSFINLKKYFIKWVFSIIRFYLYPKINKIYHKKLTTRDLENKLRRILKI